MTLRHLAIAIATLATTYLPAAAQPKCSTVSQMIFDVLENIPQLSVGLTLEPDDITAPGTPSGVGYAMDPPRLLKVGDVMECSIAGIGTLRTPIEEYRA